MRVTFFTFLVAFPYCDWIKHNNKQDVEHYRSRSKMEVDDQAMINGQKDKSQAFENISLSKNMLHVIRTSDFNGYRSIN